ncbi:hypothetical protein [Emticicia sp. W12TSBA100-4]|uniref:hypothetical protein n=1 Tax=Emticicia sp. W12TSBA100-4 TaxID=3160965 RepID=UPI003306075D
MAENVERLACTLFGNVTVKNFNMKTINVNNDGKTFIAFQNDEGLLVFNPILGGSATVSVNDNYVATELNGQMQLGSPIFSLPAFTDNIEVARQVRDKVNSISDTDFKTLENILL